MEDALIVELYWQRSDAAIPETQKKYGRYCQTVATNVLSDERDAEECVNDTYLAAWNSMPDNRPDRLPPYLGKITRNLALDRLAFSRARKRGAGKSPAVLDELSELLPGPEDPQRAVEEREVCERINAFLRSLPETERSIFVCRYWYMAEVGEIAAAFGFTRAKTASLLHRTRQKLRAVLEKEGWI